MHLNLSKRKKNRKQNAICILDVNRYSICVVLLTQVTNPITVLPGPLTPKVL